MKVGTSLSAVSGILLGCLVLLAGSAYPVPAAEPRIYLIELFGTNQVLVHFDTDANRAYTLQYLDPMDSGTNTLAAASIGPRPNHWSNLAAFPPTPFPNHYIIMDTRTNTFRLYRLAVSP